MKKAKVAKVLSEEENREIIKAYWQADYDNVWKEVYPLVEERLFSMFGEEEAEAMIEGIVAQRGTDPLEKLEESRMTIEHGSALLREDPEDNEDLIKYYRLLERAVTAQERFYASIVLAIKDVSVSRGLEVENVIGRQKYMDEASRNVFPTKKKAKAYWGLIENVALKSLKFSGQEAMIEVFSPFFEYKDRELDRIYSRSKG